MEASVFAVERILHYRFKNKRLLEEALTHPSVTHSASYQRLEFVGDAALGLALAIHVFLSYPHLDPGQLSLLRAANVSTEKLARVAIKYDLYRFLRHNAISLDDKVREFTDVVSQENDAVAHGGSVKAPKVLADIVESLAGAVYVDVNFDLQSLWVIFRGLLEPIVTHEDLQQQPQPVTLLFELCQKQGKEVDIVYWKNKSKNIASVYVDSEFVASGSSGQREIAKLKAAKAALSKLSHFMPSNVGSSDLFDSINSELHDKNKCLKPSNIEMEASVFAIERILNYSFIDKHLLEQALTHSSYMDSASYQRLEFIGDAALGLALSNHIYLAYPQLDPGQLSLLRAANISTEKLARVAIRHGLYWFMRHNATSLNDKVREFTDAVRIEDDAVAYGGSVKAPKVLADIVESVAAAVYVDVNFDLQRLWVIFRGFLEPIVTLEDLQHQPQPVTMLYEMCQKQGKEVDIINWKKGTKNIVSVYIDGEFVASGSSEQKEIAKINASRVALPKLSHLMQSNVGLNDVFDSINGPFNIEGAKQKLHELCGKKKWPKPIYSIEKEMGPAHEKKFVCSVQIATVDGVLYMMGDEKTRVKDAQNSAASLIIRALQE